MRLGLVGMLAAIASLAIAVPAQAQNQQQGLVNVAIEDVTVQVPISVAANICDVNVAVLVSEFNDAPADCEATAESAASNGGGNGGGPPTTQEGLVNVLIDDLLVQVPVSVAANVCDVNVVVLADIVNDDAAACTADADSLATQGPGAGGGGNGIFIPIDIDLTTLTGTASPEGGASFPIRVLG